MRAMGWALGVVVFAVGCAGPKQARRGDQEQAASEKATASAERIGQVRYVDRAAGFEVVRPNDTWELDVGSDPVEEGLASPVVLRNAGNGAQIVIQVGPAVAPPHQLAERLTAGMRTHPGFVTSDPEPLPLSDDAVGFRFAMGDGVLGRVAVREGAPGRILMMMATWPSDAPETARADVDSVFRSVQPVKVVD
jgi:hypothetical protein